MHAQLRRFNGLRGNSVTLSAPSFAERCLAEPRTDDDSPECLRWNFGELSGAPTSHRCLRSAKKDGHYVACVPIAQDHAETLPRGLQEKRDHRHSWWI